MFLEMLKHIFFGQENNMMVANNSTEKKITWQEAIANQSEIIDNGSTFTQGDHTITWKSDELKIAFEALCKVAIKKYPENFYLKYKNIVTIKSE